MNAAQSKTEASKSAAATRASAIFAANFRFNFRKTAEGYALFDNGTEVAVFEKRREAVKARMARVCAAIAATGGEAA